MKRLLVVDDAMSMRRLIRDVAAEAGWEVVGEATDGAEAVAAYERLRPDLVTMDLVMPVMGGSRRSGASGPPTPARASWSSRRWTRSRRCSTRSATAPSTSSSSPSSAGASSACSASSATPRPTHPEASRDDDRASPRPDRRRLGPSSPSSAAPATCSFPRSWPRPVAASSAPAAGGRGRRPRAPRRRSRPRSSPAGRSRAWPSASRPGARRPSTRSSPR